MKRSVVLLLGLVMLATACARFKRVGEQIAAPTSASFLPAVLTVSSAAASATLTPAPAANPTPDFSAMSFAEKNNLYLQLLSQRQAEGVDTAAAEEAYAQSLEATFQGNAALADQDLEQAILLLWK